jgi:hypothetical protein
LTEQFSIAVALVKAGISVIPVGPNKVPRINWREFIARRATEAELAEWYGPGSRAGIGRVGGAVSGNLETIDFDVDAEAETTHTADAIVSAWRERVESRCPGLVDRLTLIRTPRPGWHVVYRCVVPIGGNAKLAEAPKKGGGWKAIIETRGEGGYALHPGSPGECHPTGGTYAHVAGPAIEAAEPITASERDTIIAAARMFTLKPAEDAPEARERPTIRAGEGVSPGDDFSRSTSWGDILAPHGFKRVGGTAEGEEFWLRPGGSSRWSLTTNYDGSGLLYAFSPNCGLDTNRGLNKFSVFATLNHGGDFSAATRDLAARGFGPRTSDVDLSTLMAGPEQVAEAISDPPEGAKPPKPFPADLLGVPGLIADLTTYINDTSFVRQPVLALGASIALLGTLVGRTRRDPTGTRANVYAVGVCRSGGGKDRARQAIKQALFDAGAEALIGPEGFASHAGLINAVCRQPSVLFQVDEFGRVLKGIKGAGSGATHLMHILTALMKLYTSSSSVFKSDAYADEKHERSVYNPNANLYGTTVPQSLFESLTPESLTDGFVSRLLIFEGDQSARPVPGGPAASETPAGIVSTIKFWVDEMTGKGRGNLADQFPEAIEIPYSAAGLAAMNAFGEEASEYVVKGRTEADRAIWSRAVEKARKLAMIFACSADHLAPAVDGDAAQWATVLSRYLTTRVQAMAEEWVSETAYEGTLKAILRIVRNDGNVISRAILNRKCRWLKNRERMEAIADLVGQGHLVEETRESGGRPALVYRLNER